MAASRRAQRIKYTLPEQAVATSSQLPPEFARLKWLTYAKQYRRNLIQYKTLRADETRLILLKGYNQADDPVEIKLIENVRFDDMGKFEALSYHWGNAMSHEPIYFVEDEDSDGYSAAQAQPVDHFITQPVMQEVNGDNAVQKLGKMIAQRHFFPTENLYRALTHLRLQNEDCRIWVSAVCIDQSNNEERSSQVQRMGDIYATATTVLIWLGEGDNKTKEAMQFAKRLIKDPTKISEFVHKDEHTESWQNLLHLMRSSWFSRRWIIQELALASDATVSCGSSDIHWTDLRDAISIFTENFDAIRERFKRSAQRNYNALGEIEPLHAKKLVDNITSIFRRHPHIPERGLEPLLGLEYLVSELAILDATDPRDTINAFRNVARETFRDRGKGPQKHGYTVDLLTVYMSFVKWVVEVNQCLDIICRRWAIPEKTERDSSGNYPELVCLPSWIQTVDADDRSNAVSGQRRHGDTFVSLPGERAYKVCLDLKPDVDFGDEGTLQHYSRLAALRPDVVVSSPSSAATIPSDQTVPGEGVQPDAQDSTVSQDMNDSQPTSHNGEARHEANAQQKDAQRRVLEAWPTMFRTATSSTGINHNKRKADLYLHPEAVARTRMHRRVSVSGSNPASPTSVHLPELHGKAVLRQLVTRKVDASLWTKGIVIGPVQHICLMTDGVIGRDVFFELYGTQKIERGQEVPEMVWRTLVAERGPNNTVPPALYPRACQYAMSFLNPNKDLNIKELREQAPADFMKPFLKRVEAVIWNRCFFKVKGTHRPDMVYRGFGPYTVRDDDILCILYGCNVPCILRPCHSSRIGTYYSMIGEAYVYGIMDGDFIESLGETVEQRTETFRIL